MAFVPTIIETYPLAPIQQGIVFESLVSDRAVYLQQHILRLREELSPQKLQRALEALAARHPILRSAFIPNQAGGYDQAVYDSAVVPFQRVDLGRQSQTVQNERIELFLEQDRSQKFELGTAPLLRAGLLSVTPDDHILVLTFHHAITDARSYSLFTSELFTIYDCFLSGQTPKLKPPTPYRDYVEWIGKQDLSQAEIFWSGYLQGAGDPPQIELADMRRDPEAEPGSRAGLPNEIAAQLPAEAAGRLRKLCADENITLNTIFQAGWGLLISRLSRSRDFMIGATRSCRRSVLDGETERLMGPILNTLPLRIQIDPQQPLRMFLHDLRRAWVEMRPYENSALHKIVEWNRAIRGQPLFNTICNFSYESPAAAVEADGGKPKTRLTELYQQLDYPLSASMTAGAEITLRLNYDNRRYERTAAKNLLGALSGLLENISRHPESRLGELILMTDAEVERVVYDWNPESSPAPGMPAFWQRIRSWARQQPDNPAVIEGWTDPHTGEARSITYRQLEERTNQIARFLMSRGAGPEVRIGICMERSIEFVLAFLGVLKSGAVYVALDPDLPPKRLAYMVADTGVQTVIAQGSTTSRLPESLENLLRIDQLDGRIAACSPAELEIRIDPQNLAYIIYTSGSSGQPKGVMNTQEGLSNLLTHFTENYRLQPEDRMLAQTPISFDPSIYDPFCPLVYGAALVLCSPGRNADIDTMIETSIRMEVSVWHVVASLASAALDHPDLDKCTRLRLLMTGGESMPASLPARLPRRMPFQASNSYGPAENCLRSTSIFLPADGDWPFNSVGRPIEHTRAYILDENMNPLPPGIAGEIYLGGSSLGRGYCGQPGLTAERFVPDPFGPPGGRLYRTGDFGRFHLDGQIEYLGRQDNQVKLNGVRIEIEEIEHFLEGHPAVSRAGVCLRQGKTGPYLAAIIQTTASEKPDPKEIRSYLRQHLPAKFIPMVIQSVRQLPVLPSGKLDRQALQQVEVDEQIADGRPQPPGGPLEILLTRLFGRVLGRDQVGLGDDFFSLGGNSLHVMKAIALINETLGVQLPLRALFEAPSAADLRDLLAAQEGEPGQIEEIARLRLELDDLQADSRD